MTIQEYIELHNDKEFCIIYQLKDYCDKCGKALYTIDKEYSTYISADELNDDNDFYNGYDWVFDIEIDEKSDKEVNIIGNVIIITVDGFEKEICIECDKKLSEELYS